MTTLKQLISDLKLTYVHSDINEDNFSIPESLNDDYKVFKFGRDISSEDAVKEIEKEGYSPANIYELLTWAKDWNGKDWVVALGQKSQLRWRGDHGVGSLLGGDSVRYLGLLVWADDWSALYGFLAVRRNVASGKLENSGTSVTLEPFDPSEISFEYRGKKYQLIEQK